MRRFGVLTSNFRLAIFVLVAGIGVRLFGEDMSAPSLTGHVAFGMSEPLQDSRYRTVDTASPCHSGYSHTKNGPRKYSEPQRRGQKKVGKSDCRDRHVLFARKHEPPKVLPDEQCSFETNVC